MRAFVLYALKRLGQFVLVVFIGINIAYIITHATPIDPVEQSVAMATNFGQTSPEAINMLRASLRELYGLTGTPLEQYTNFWWRIIKADFGPSLSSFPTPVTTLIARALPWTIGLLTTAILLAWALGNLLGGLAGYYRESRFFRFLGVVAMGLHPVPYYIAGFALIVVFGYLWPVLPITGGSDINMHQTLDLNHVLSVLRHSILPALSLMLIAIGGWFLGMRSLVSNVVTEDYVTYAELGGVAHRRILYSYVMRNALVPQVTGLAMSLGITEQIFGYPGIGSLLVSGVYAGDYGLVLGVTTMSIIGVSAAVLLIDLVYPLLDPRVEAR
jgi:peptide/nickel transport system permease protein